MDWQYWFVFGALAGLFTASNVRAQASEFFSGFYGGLEGGAISYNTRIVFDGVDDPAGRGDVMYGVFSGYNHTYEKLMVGAELSFHLAAHPEPYTFDPAVVGFAELDVWRGASVGLDVRAGYLVTERVLLTGYIGYSINSQSVRIDDIPLDRFAGGAAAETFGAFQSGAGLEVILCSSVGIRASFRTLAGHDLSAPDFGTIPRDASITRFDVEPRQHQYLAGLMVRL